MRTSPEAKSYHRIKNSLFVVNLLFSLLVLLVIIFSGFSIWLKEIKNPLKITPLWNQFKQ